jgi:hypothetical protein
MCKTWPEFLALWLTNAISFWFNFPLGPVDAHPLACWKRFSPNAKLASRWEQISTLLFLAPTVSCHVRGISSNNIFRCCFAMNFIIQQFLLVRKEFKCSCNLYLYLIWYSLSFSYLWRPKTNFSRLCLVKNYTKDDRLPMGTILPK